MTEVKEVSRVEGATFCEAVERGDQIGMLEIDKDSTSKNICFEQTCFSVGSHFSSVLDEDSSTLVLSINSDGDLWSDYDGDRRESVIRPGVFQYVPTGVLQQYDFKGQTTNIATAIKPNLIARLREQNPEFSDIRLDEPLRGFTRPRLAQLVVNQNRLIRSGEMGWRSLADANMVQLGIELMCMLAKRPPKASTPLTTEEVQLAEAYLRANLEENIPLADIAELLGRDVFGFSRAFKAATGSTFHQFSLQLRITEATLLLKKTTEPLAQIAVATGFSSQAHMTTTMRKMTGFTPGAVRAGS